MTAQGVRFVGAIQALQCPEIEGLQEHDGEDEVQTTAPEMECEQAATSVKGTLTGERHAVDKGWRAGGSEWQCQALIANGAGDNITRQRSNARASGMNRAADDLDEMAGKLCAASLDIRTHITLADKHMRLLEGQLNAFENGRCQKEMTDTGGERHAPGWCTDRADHRPWSAGRSSSAASAASTFAATPTKNVRDSSRRHSLFAQSGEGRSADPKPQAPHPEP